MEVETCLDSVDMDTVVAVSVDLVVILVGLVDHTAHAVLTVADSH